MNEKLQELKTILKHDQFFEASIYDLMLYYYDKKCYQGKLNKKQKKAILELANIKHKQNQEEADLWIRSGLFNLSCEQLIRHKKATKTILNNESWYYNANITDIISNMAEIIRKSTARSDKEHQNKLDLLRNYCEGR